MEIKLKLKIKDIEIELSETEAKELNKMLQGLFAERVVIEKEIIMQRYPTYPYYPGWKWIPDQWPTFTYISDNVLVSYETVG